ncbi:MAG: hypothetical protein U5Q03_17955 [Bacteroidota bacterium]|nr:hypothetical protein [Bacteroidota bacterium]
MKYTIIRNQKSKIVFIIIGGYIIPFVYLYLANVLPLLLFALLLLVYLVLLGIYVSTARTYKKIGIIELSLDSIKVKLNDISYTLDIADIMKFYVSYAGYAGQLKLYGLSLWKGGYGIGYRGSGNVFNIETTKKKFRLNCILYSADTKSKLKEYIELLKTENPKANVNFKISLF